MPVSIAERRVFSRAHPMTSRDDVNSHALTRVTTLSLPAITLLEKVSWTWIFNDYREKGYG